jgi:signal transduction histidine kinase
LKVSLSIITLFLFAVSGLSQEKITVLLQRLHNSQDDSSAVLAYHQIFRYYQYANPDSAEWYLNQGLTKFQKKNYQIGIAYMMYGLGSLDVSHGNLEMARKRENDAMQIFKELQYKPGMASVFLELGGIEGRKGNFELATRYSIASLKLNQEIKNKAGISSAYNNLGIINTGTGNLDIALNYYAKALEYTGDSSSPRSIWNIYNNIGSIYGRKGKFDSAGFYCSKALALSSDPEFADVHVSSMMNMGIIFQNIGKIDSALSYFNAALQISIDKKLPEQQARLLVNLATIFIETSPQKAISLLNQALDIAIKLGNKSLLEDTYYNLRENYKTLGNYKEVAKLLEQEMNIKDSLYSVEKAKEIANLGSIYELEQSNNKISQLNLEMQTQSLKRDILLVTALSLIVCVLAITFYYRKTRHLYEVVKKQKEELTASNTIKDKLFSVIGHDLRGPAKNILMVIDLLESEQTTADQRSNLLNLLKVQSQSSMETLEALLFWGKSQIQGAAAKPGTFDAAELVKKNVNLLGITAMQKKATIINNVAAGTKIHADATHFDFTIRNLLANAIKYSYTNGTIEINVLRDKLPGFTVFTVTDHGVGITPAQLSSVFDGFVNSSVGTDGEKGTGIGLMLCREFAVANGGSIWVESAQGIATTFFCSFKNA